MASEKLKKETISRLRSILTKARSAGVSESELRKYLETEEFLPSGENRRGKGTPSRCSCLSLHCIVFRVLPAVSLLSLLYFPLSELLSGSPCLVSQLTPFPELAHPLLNCSFCEGVTGAPRHVNLSRMEFMHKYAYTGRPVVVVGAASSWPAINVFSYEYFKNLYLQTPESIDADKNTGQFFSYSSNIQNLRELFDLSSDRASMASEKWYIGWSTADPTVGAELRKHFSMPYFLPPGTTMPDVLAWIFMGAPGPGASIHIDSVDLPSWQAQLSGTKTWTLTPPPECEHVCLRFNITVHTGDIIVLDTNRWYHETYIHPGNISITIGTEYQ